MIRNVFRGLRERSQKADTPSERHNLRTLLALYGLAVGCGLRISEAGSLQCWQIDLDATWNGQPLPWIMLPDAKGNRFTTAARLVPIPDPPIPLLRSLLPGDRQVPAFTFRRGDRQQAVSPASIRQHLNRLELPFPRWHAGRHLLRTHLMLQGLEFDVINMVMGHQSAGREVFNPFTPDWTRRGYAAFRHSAARLLHSLGFPEMEDGYIAA